MPMTVPEVLEEYGPCDLVVLCRHTGLTPSAVWARINPLIKRGEARTYMAANGKRLYHAKSVVEQRGKPTFPRDRGHSVVSAESVEFLAVASYLPGTPPSNKRDVLDEYRSVGLVEQVPGDASRYQLTRDGQRLAETLRKQQARRRA